MNQFYAVAFIAEKESSYIGTSGWVYATNEDEADGHALRLCRERYPFAQGYHSHQVCLHYIGQISDDRKTIITSGEKFNFVTSDAMTQSPNDQIIQ